MKAQNYADAVSSFEMRASCFCSWSVCRRSCSAPTVVRFLPWTRTLSALFPVGQYLPQISFRALQCLNVCFDTLEFFLGKLIHTAAGSPSSITTLQDFSQFSQGQADPKLCTTSTLSTALAGQTR